MPFQASTLLAFALTSVLALSPRLGNASNEKPALNLLERCADAFDLARLQLEEAQARLEDAHRLHALRQAGYDDVAAATRAAAASGDVEQLKWLRRVSLHPQLVWAELRPLLLTGSWNVNAPDDQGMTPLMLAARAGKSEAVQWLLENKARTDLVGPHGLTAMAFACAAFDPNSTTIELLLRAGASATAAPAERGRLLAIATLSGSSETLRTLLNHRFQGDWSQDRLLEAMQVADAIKFMQRNNLSSLDSIPMYLASKPSVNALDQELLRGLSLTRTEFFRNLLASPDVEHLGLRQLKPWDPDAMADSSGFTPLTYALANRSFDLALLLLDHGADPLKADDQGHPPAAYLKDARDQRAKRVADRIAEAEAAAQPASVPPDPR